MTIPTCIEDQFSCANACIIFLKALKRLGHHKTLSASERWKKKKSKDNTSSDVKNEVCLKC